MPYIGLLPFLLPAVLLNRTCICPVSMPYIGLLPFLRSENDDGNGIYDLCQCPTSGFSHFYRG